MSRESRRKQKKERQARKQAERDARRMYERMLKDAQGAAAAANKRIAEQMKIDRAARAKQAAIYKRDLTDAQNKAASDLKILRDDFAGQEAARIKREKISSDAAKMQAQMAAKERKIGAGNEARAAAGATGLQIRVGEDGSSVAGTPQFKRRKNQFNAGSYGGVNAMKSDAINI